MASTNQVANLLNQQITAKYRKHKINLNTKAVNFEAGSLLGDVAATEDSPLASGASTPPPIASTSAAMIPTTEEAEMQNGTSSPNPSKRKARTTLDTPSTSAPSKRPKSSRSLAPSSRPSSKLDSTPPTSRLCDLGGVSECIEQILELVAMPICHPEIYLHTGVRPPRGVLLHGPPGCGKTMLAGAIAGELGCPFINVSAPSIVSGMSGESEKTLRDTFEEAAKLAPCILFIDEIDAITPKRENAQREMERRIVAQLLTCMDDLSWDKTDNKPVMVIGATNRPDSLDAALRRAGRFDHEIAMSVPDQAAREQILRVLASRLRLSGDFDYTELARRTPGYVGADLTSLTGVAGIIAVKRIFQEMATLIPDFQPPAIDAMMLDEADTPSTDITNEAQDLTIDRPNLFASLPTSLSILAISSFLQRHPDPLTEDELSPLSINNDDFNLALLQVQPSSKREGFTTVPDVTWADIGALSSIRDELQMALVQPIKRPELFASMGILNPCGVLLWGPPGCGKTLLAKAVANESMANFISVKGPELLNKYVGESERAVRQVFNRARASAPCIIFFDELDALVPRRDDSLSESSSRVVNTLLTELDGLEPRKQVYVIGATNRPDIIDPAMVRPGRLDKMLYVDLPTAEERYEILKAQTMKTPFDQDVDLVAIAQLPKCEGFSGADLSALVREAAVSALRERFQEITASGSAGEQVLIGQRHLVASVSKVAPSVSAAQRRRYEALRARYSGIPIGRKGDAEIEVDGKAEGEQTTL